MSLDLVKSMKLTAEEHNGSHTICFAGQGMAQLMGKQEVATASWYMGRGRPQDFPLDVWIWGGISLATERVLGREELYRQSILMPLMLCMCAGLPLYGHAAKLAFWAVVFVTLGMMMAVYLWRVIKVRQVVQQVLSPKLNSLGFVIEAHQRPWFSYYTIRRSYSTIVPLLQDKPAAEVILPFSLEEDGALKLPLIASVPWDWQGYARVLPGTQCPKESLNVWVWGALLETARGRAFVAESTSPPLIAVRRLRILRTLSSVAFILFGWLCTWLNLVYLHVPHYGAPWVWMALQWVLLLACLAGRWWTGFGKPLLLVEPFIEIVEAAMEELGPAIQAETGIVVELDEMVNRHGLWGWQYELYHVKLYLPEPSETDSDDSKHSHEAMEII